MKSMIKHIKKSLPETKIIAGNVATPDAVEDLAEWGADVVKVGIGQGSPCTTKDKTGFTTPMFSCVQACAHFYPLNVPLIADGGIKSNGDIAKALVAGATMVMAGSIFAACSDSPATSSTINDVSHKAYFGSASLENKGHNNHIEGKLTQVVDNNMSYKEKLAEIKQDLQSSISYSGGLGLDSFCNTKYIEV
jgi:GMP reductase